MRFKVGDVISLSSLPYKPFKVIYVSNFLHDDTVIITPVGKFENKSFRRTTMYELNEMGYVLYVIHWKGCCDIVKVPVMSGPNEFKYLVYRRTNNPSDEYEYILIGDE